MTNLGINPGRSDAIRLLHVTNAPFTIKQFLDGQTAFMRNHGVEIHVAARSEGLAGEYDRNGICEVHSIPIIRDLAPLSDVRALFKLQRLIARLRPDLVHGHTPKGGLLAMLAASSCRVPGIYHCRGLPFSTATGAKRVLLRKTERVSLTLARRVLCVSNSLRQVLLDEGLCSPSKATVPGGGGSGNGVDTAKFHPDRHGPSRHSIRAAYGIPADAPVVGFVGRLIREKGIHELLGAFNYLKSSFPQLNLLIVGPFDERDRIGETARRELMESKGIHLAGYQAEPAAYYAAMDVLALPTYREGFPAVALEAGAMRIPVVATRVTGCVDSIVDGVTGILISPRSVDALVAGLQAYLQNPSLRERHGYGAREHVLRYFRQDLIWRDILAVYRELSRKNASIVEAEA